MAHLREQGVQAAVHYPFLIPGQGALANTEIRRLDELSRAADIAASEISLPIHPHLTDDEVERVIEAANTWRPT